MTPPKRSGTELGEDVSYVVDGEDRIESVSAGWVKFALANHGTHLLPPDILGVRLWDAIRDPTTRDVYRALLRRVRQGAGPVRFRIRCDSPGIRRLLDMEISGGEGEKIVFGIRTTAEQPRPSIPLLNNHRMSQKGILAICSWCMRIHTGEEEWLEVEAAIAEVVRFDQEDLPRLSHGMCPDCYAAVNRSLEQSRDTQEGAPIRIELGIGLPG